MSLKKNWFAWIVWAVYSIVVGAFLGNYIYEQCVVRKLGLYVSIVIVCGTFLCVFGMYRILCLLYEKLDSRLSYSGRSKILLEGLLFTVLFAGAIFTRVSLWFYHPFADFFGTMQYYEMATIKDGITIPLIHHGASYLYTGLLSVLFSLLGNKQEVGIIMQLVLQLGGIVFSYFAVRNMLGKKNAIVSAAILSFFPAMLYFGYSFQPENLYFFLFAGMFLLLSLFRKYEEKQERNKIGVAIISILTGIGISYLTYLDAIGILLLLAAWFIVFETKKKEPFFDFGFLTGGFCVGMSALFWIDALITHTTFESVFMTWWNLYFREFALKGIIAGPDLSMTGNLLGCIGALCLSFAFFYKREVRCCLYMFSLLVLSFGVSFGTANMSYQLLATVYWAILAATGVVSVTTKKQKPEEAAVTVKEVAGDTNENRDGDDKKEIQFIENPLPLPKKHVKKTMGYQFEPEEHLMKYDIEVKDDDDFDLK